MKLRNKLLYIVNDIPLNIKFLIIYIVCLLIPILVINAVFYDRFTKTVHEREKNNYQISLDRTKVDIDSIIEGCIAVSHSISTDRALYNVLDTSFESGKHYYEIYDSILRNKLNLYTNVYNYIGSVGLYVDNPTIRTGGTYYYSDKTVKNTSWYKELANSKQTVLIKAYIDSTNRLPIRQTPYLSILRSSRGNPSLGHREKILKIDVDFDKVASILMREKDYLSLYLVDNDNNIVCSSTALYDYNDVHGFIKFQPDMVAKDVLVLETSLGKAGYLNGWKLIGEANVERLSNATRETLRLILSLVLVTVLISTLLIFIIVRSYNYRLKKLSGHMLKLNEEQFDLIEINEGRDEIGGVIRNFNLMAAKINSLINDVYKLELQKKNLELERVRAELNYLQSQMNPHFLFNTLNALHVVSVKNNYSAITDVLKYLSKTLRRLLSWKDDLVTIEEELSFTEMYLKIEKFRFCDKFEYRMNVNSNLLGYKLPKMSLQPLVENACVHGLQTIKGVGIVEIVISPHEKGMLVSVKDNGTGMTDEKLEELILNMSSEDECGLSIGIRNVYRRLSLYYGDQITLNIESRLNEGTTVSFIIPHDGGLHV